MYAGNRVVFLCNYGNKQALINIIVEELKHITNYKVIQSAGDADVDIVLSALNSCLLYNTTLVGEDTDLLVLLLHYYRDRKYSHPLKKFWVI